MTVFRPVKLRPLRERKRDLGFPILCLLFAISRCLDVYSTIVAYEILGREFFNPMRNSLVQLVLYLLSGRPVVPSSGFEISLLGAPVIYYHGVTGLWGFQLALTAVLILNFAVFWWLSWYMSGWQARCTRSLTKGVLFILTIGGAGVAIANHLQLLPLTYS